MIPYLYICCNIFFCFILNFLSFIFYYIEFNDKKKKPIDLLFYFSNSDSLEQSLVGGLGTDMASPQAAFLNLSTVQQERKNTNSEGGDLCILHHGPFFSFLFLFFFFLCPDAGIIQRRQQVIVHGQQINHVLFVTFRANIINY